MATGSVTRGSMATGWVTRGSMATGSVTRGSMATGSTWTGGSGCTTAAGVRAKGTTSARRARRPTTGASAKNDGGSGGTEGGSARRRPGDGREGTSGLGSATTTAAGWAGFAATRRPTYGWSVTCSAEWRATRFPVGWAAVEPPVPARRSPM